jgi:hypothetical protein
MFYWGIIQKGSHMHRRNSLLFLLILITLIPAMYFLEICRLHNTLLLFLLFFYIIYALCILPLCLQTVKLIRMHRDKLTPQNKLSMFLLASSCFLFAPWLIPTLAASAAINIFDFLALLLKDVVASYCGIVLFVALLRFLRARFKPPIQPNVRHPAVLLFGAALFLTTIEATLLPLISKRFREAMSLKDASRETAEVNIDQNEMEV